MCEKSVEVWVQAERQRLTVVTPVNVGQSPEQEQENLLDQEDEACWERCTWRGTRGKLETGTRPGAGRDRGVWFTCFCGEHVFVSQQVVNVGHGVVEVKWGGALQLPAVVVDPDVNPETVTGL